MKERTLLLAGLVDEDDIETTRQNVVESYETQFEEDRVNLSENVSFVEDDELRLIRLIGETEEEPEWEGNNVLNERAGLGGYGPGFASYGMPSVSSRYIPNRKEAFGAILGTGHHENSEWGELDSPKVELFKKIAESNPGAFTFGQQTINEDDLPEFDEDFNPILGESELSAKDHYRSVMDRGKVPAINSEEYPEIPGLEGPFMFRTSGWIGYYDPREGKYYDSKSDMYLSNEEAMQLTESEKYNFFDDEMSALQEKIHNGELAVQGGIGPGFEAYDGVKREHLDVYASASDIMEKWYLGEKTDTKSDKIKSNLEKAKKVMDKTEKRSEERRSELDEMKEQPDLPGELADVRTPAPTQQVPQEINLTNMTLKYLGKKSGLFVYGDKFNELRVVLQQEQDGSWWAQAYSDFGGLVGEGEGASVEDAARAAVSYYTGEPELPSTLNRIEKDDTLLETVEGTDGNAWYYRRTGTPDDYHIKFRENDNPTMHPVAKEQPSSVGYPGMAGWSFYEGDHTYQKMEAQMEDVLDDGEATATEEIMQKFFKKYSVYGEQ